ncbi:hypothetical protein ABHI18_008070 [Aspergillus niger]
MLTLRWPNNYMGRDGNNALCENGQYKTGYSGKDDDIDVFLLTLAATALAAPSLHTREDLKYVRVTVQQHRITTEKQIVVKDSSTEDIFGSACSNALKPGFLPTSVSSQMLGLTGEGNITAGPPYLQRP